MTVLLGGAVAAQSDAPVDPMAPAAVTVTQSEGRTVSYPSTEVDDAGVTHYRDIEATMDWVASDPRLSGAATYHGAWDEYGGYSIETNTYEVVNDGGRWFGPAMAATVNDVWVETILLDGEGGYEGLTAYVLHTVPNQMNAIIFPGEPIPMPERSPAP
jgi:hypothetical protein